MQESELEAVVDFLGRTKGFSEVPVADLRQLATTVEIKKFDDGEFVIRKGERSNSILVIQDGLVRVPIYDQDDKLKLEVRLAAGSIVGEIAMLTGIPRTADVIAAGNVVALEFRQDVIDPLLRAYPKLAHFLTEIVAKRIEEDQALQDVGNYHLGRAIGNGSTAKVFEATHRRFHRFVAVKMLSHALAYDHLFAARFSREAELIAQMSHPNIIQVYDLCDGFGTQFIIMELAAGGTLGETLHREEFVPERIARPALRQVGEALAHAHEHGIVHRDVKPANIAMCDKGIVKLMDFGIAAKFVGDGADAQRVEGSPAYMAPEVIRNETVDGRADIYALGITAFTVLTGRLPFPPTTMSELLSSHLHKPPPDPRELGADLSANTLAFIQGALVKDPAERLTDWNRILELLDDSDPISLRTSERGVAADNRRGPERRSGVERRQETVAVEAERRTGIERRRHGHLRRRLERRIGVDRRSLPENGS